MKLSPLLVILALATATSAASGATIYVATLSGANEVPPSGSTGFGSITVTLNGDLLTLSETFSGLIGGVASAAHIHCCALAGTNAGVAVPFPGFPNAASGTYLMTVDLTSAATYTSAFISASGGTAALAEANLIGCLNTSRTYANIHDAQFPGGEIRGQLTAAPEPVTVALTGASLFMLGLLRRRRSDSHVS